MNDVATLIEALGNPAAISRDTGIPLTTIDGWRRNRFVPAWRVDTLVALARKKKLAITAADFPATRPITDKVDAA